jgi:hypothetical protein
LLDTTFTFAVLPFFAMRTNIAAHMRVQICGALRAEPCACTFLPSCVSR